MKDGEKDEGGRLKDEKLPAGSAIVHDLTTDY